MSFHSAHAFIKYSNIGDNYYWGANGMGRISSHNNGDFPKIRVMFESSSNFNFFEIFRKSTFLKKGFRGLKPVQLITNFIKILVSKILY